MRPRLPMRAGLHALLFRSGLRRITTDSVSSERLIYPHLYCTSCKFLVCRVCGIVLIQSLPLLTQAAGSGLTYVCKSKSTLDRGIPNALGKLCFLTHDACMDSSNACTDSTCALRPDLCGTGLVTGAAVPHSWVCEYNYPNNSLSTGSGTLCYNSLPDCLASANDCAVDNICIQDEAYCQTGAAAPEVGQYNFYCPSDVASLSRTNAAGKLCFATQGAA